MGTHYKPPRAGEVGEAQVRALNAFITLMRSAEAVSRRVNRHLTDFDLTIRQWGVIEALYHRGPLMQNALAQKLLCTPGNLTGVIDKLSKKQLVLVRKLEDKRCHELRLTATGRTLVERILPAHVQAITAAFSALRANEQEQLRGLCRKLGLSIESPY